MSPLGKFIFLGVLKPNIPLQIEALLGADILCAYIPGWNFVTAL
jgi:hypothetical protein